MRRAAGRANLPFGSQQTARRESATNFVYNRLSSFTPSNDHFCRSCFWAASAGAFRNSMSGFEGGVAWPALQRPARILGEAQHRLAAGEHGSREVDLALMEDMFGRYGDDI
jgi:hypothetical protein